MRRPPVYDAPAMMVASSMESYALLKSKTSVCEAAKVTAATRVLSDETGSFSMSSLRNVVTWPKYVGVEVMLDASMMNTTSVLIMVAGLLQLDTGSGLSLMMLTEAVTTLLAVVMV